MDLSVVIPAYREADALRLLLPKLNASLAALPVRSEVLVIDTEGSLDDTKAVCQEFGARHVAREGGNVYGCAIHTGISRATGDYVLMMDADGSHDPGQIERLWNARAGRHIVIGSRYIAGGGTDNPQILIFMSYVVNVTFRVVFGLSCRDVSNSFRLYRAETLRHTPFFSDNFDLIPELLIRISARFGRDAVTEVPVYFGRRTKGESKRNLVAFALGYVHTIWRLKRITRRGA